MTEVDTLFFRPILAELLRKTFGKWQGIRGVPRLLWWLRSLAFPSVSVLVKTPDGFPFVLDRDDYGQVMLYYFPYCPELQAILSDAIKLGDLCLDLGANVGLLTAHMANCVGEKGKVIAVEPNPPVFAQLKRMAAQSFPGNVEVVSVGIAAKDGMGSLYLPQGRFSESVEVTQAKVNGNSLELLSVTSVVRRYLHGCNPDLIKIDIEGNEADLLESMDGLVSQGCRPILLVEFHPQKCEQRGVDVIEVVQHLGELGYQVRRVERLDESYRLVDIFDRPVGHDNLLFVVSSHLATHGNLALKWDD